jgi:hypothetical protein
LFLGFDKWMHIKLGGESLAARILVGVD